MIDASTLDYDFDEEAGFGEPAPEPRPVMPALQRLGLAIVGVGLLSLLVQVFWGFGNGTWLGFASSLGALSAGAMLTFWASYRDTTPGIKHDGVWFSSLLARGALGWVAAILMTGLYVLLYWYPEYLGYQPAVWGDGGQVEPAKVTGGLVQVVDPLARWMIGGPSSQWFLYGVLYSLSMLTFGVRMVMKYRHNRYQLIRTGSVLFFQLVFAWVLPNILILFQKPYWEFNGLWPLKYDYLWPGKVSELWNTPGALGVFLLFWGVVTSLVAVPVLTYFFGKRWYCSWVCGCGGLAETVGDGWRQLSDKSTRAWHFERWIIHGVLVFVLVVTGLLWTNHLTDGGVFGSFSYQAKAWYGFYIGALFSGVAGVGFYPLLGNRVWCRFGCPQAAILGLLQRYFSRFRITTNGGQCMSCGNCSTYCEMGIDVRAYAQKGDNIIRASCVGCGVCSAVCPRGVLKLENGPETGDRYAGAEQPVRQFVRDLAGRPQA